MGTRGRFYMLLNESEMTQVKKLIEEGLLMWQVVSDKVNSGLCPDCVNHQTTCHVSLLEGNMENALVTDYKYHHPQL